MRITFLAIATLAIGGCAGTGGTRQQPPIVEVHKTPVAKTMPSPSQRQMARRLQAGQEVTGKIEVEGSMVR